MCICILAPSVCFCNLFLAMGANAISLLYLIQEKCNLIFMLNINEAKLILFRILIDANIWF